MRLIALLLLSCAATSAVGQLLPQQASWPTRSRLQAGLQLPASPVNPSVLAYRTPVLWPLRAAEARELPPIYAAREPSYHYSIPRELFTSQEAFRRYYLDHPHLVRERQMAPSLMEVPRLHTGELNWFNIPFSL